MGERFTVEAEVKNLEPVRRLVAEWASAQGAATSAIDGLVMAVDESVTNVITHGYRSQPGMVEICLDLDGEEMVVCITDQAPLFDPTAVPPPDLTLPLEQRVAGGLGIFLARKSVDSYSYRVNPKGENELTLRKTLLSKK